MLIDKPRMAVGGEIVETFPIEGADRIQRAEVICGESGRWSCVVDRDVPVGTAVVVFMHDAVLQPDPRWTFMEKHGYRVKMMRLRGCPSEVLAVPDPMADGKCGADFTDELGVKKASRLLRGNARSRMTRATRPFRRV